MNLESVRTHAMQRMNAYHEAAARILRALRRGQVPDAHHARAITITEWGIMERDHWTTRAGEATRTIALAHAVSRLVEVDA